MAFTSKNEILRIAGYNVGFKKFVESLNEIEANDE
jgi:hypothetical protein